nr:MAG TPA: hypothetical protein [Caudoviricetes sp.]
MKWRCAARIAGLRAKESPGGFRFLTGAKIISTQGHYR